MTPPKVQIAIEAKGFPSFRIFPWVSFMQYGIRRKIPNYYAINASPFAFRWSFLRHRLAHRSDSALCIREAEKMRRTYSIKSFCSIGSKL